MKPWFDVEITEKRDYTGDELYHVTNNDGLRGMIKSGAIEGSRSGQHDQGFGLPKGRISLSRSQNYWPHDFLIQIVIKLDELVKAGIKRVHRKYWDTDWDDIDADDPKRIPIEVRALDKIPFNKQFIKRIVFQDRVPDDIVKALKQSGIPMFNLDLSGPDEIERQRGRHSRKELINNDNMKPWFIKEGDILKFPEPEKKVLHLPNVGSYPDFVTGVTDLQARLKAGDFSKESYDKLYTDLIHRFMKKENVETPWFMESPEGIMSLTKQIQNLPPDTDPAILDKINDYIQLAQDKQEDPEANIYTRISRKVKGIDDQDMQKYYKIVSKFMIGNGLSGKQIDAIINAINSNKCVSLDELKKTFTPITKLLLALFHIISCCSSA